MASVSRAIRLHSSIIRSRSSGVTAAWILSPISESSLKDQAAPVLLACVGPGMALPNAKSPGKLSQASVDLDLPLRAVPGEAAPGGSPVREGSREDASRSFQTVRAFDVRIRL